MGGRRQRQDRRLPHGIRRRRHPRPGRQQRRPHRHRRRLEIRAAPAAVRNPLGRQNQRHRQRRGARPRRPRPGNRTHRKPGHRHHAGQTAHFRPLPRRAALPQGTRRRTRSLTRRSENRHHQARHRSVLCRQDQPLRPAHGGFVRQGIRHRPDHPPGGRGERGAGPLRSHHLRSHRGHR